MSAILWNQALELDLDLTPGEHHIFLILTSYARDDGTSIYPSVPTIQKRAHYKSPRKIPVIVHSLEKKGFLIADGHGPKASNKWRIPLKDGIITPCIKCTPALNAPALNAPPPLHLIPKTPALNAPESLINRQDESLLNNNNNNSLEIKKIYEAEIGNLTPEIQKEINQFLNHKISTSRMIEAIKLGAIHNKRNWAYVRKILENGLSGKKAPGTKSTSPTNKRHSKPIDEALHGQAVIDMLNKAQGKAA